MGPLERKLYLRAAACFSIPPGRGIADGIKFFQDEKIRASVMLQAKEWTADAIAQVRAALDADPRWTTEDIAGQILTKLLERQQAIIDSYKKRPE